MRKSTPQNSPATPPPEPASKPARPTVGKPDGEPASAAVDGARGGGPAGGGGGYATPRGGSGYPSHGRRATDGAVPTGRARPADRMLGLLLLAAEREVRVGLTVTVDGVVVTGTLIGTLAYCRALADQFASSAGGTDMDDLFADSFRDLVDDAAGVAQGDRRQPPDAASYEQSVSFLHLADARYVGAAGLLPHGRHGILWRCPVSDISGWSMGDLTAR